MVKDEVGKREIFFFQGGGGIRDLVRSRGLGDGDKRQIQPHGLADHALLLLARPNERHPLTPKVTIERHSLNRVRWVKPKGGTEYHLLAMMADELLSRRRGMLSRRR